MLSQKNNYIYNIGCELILKNEVNRPEYSNMKFCKTDNMPFVFCCD